MKREAWAGFGGLFEAILRGTGGQEMADIMSPEKRSALMSRIRGRDTLPEKMVRHLLWRAGYRYRLHRKDLPGRPVIVFPGRRKVVFVHGCFWHLHDGCKNVRLPKSRQDFWPPKLLANRERDLRNQQLLRELGWDVLVVWECETADPDALLSKLKCFLDDEEVNGSAIR